MSTDCFDKIYTHYVELEEQDQLIKRRKLSYVQKKWLVPYKCLKQDVGSTTTDTHYFTDTLYGCKYMYDVKRNRWTCRS